MNRIAWISVVIRAGIYLQCYLHTLPPVGDDPAGFDSIVAFGAPHACSGLEDLAVACNRASRKKDPMLDIVAVCLAGFGVFRRQTHSEHLSRA
jgi:hypothetical protein